MNLPLLHFVGAVAAVGRIWMSATPDMLSELSVAYLRLAGYAALMKCLIPGIHTHRLLPIRSIVLLESYLTTVMGFGVTVSFCLRMASILL
jgi:hypothetical protein